MTIYAQLVNSIVVNVIVADADFVAQSELDYVLMTRGGIDWTYDSTNNVFIAPQPYPSWTLDSNYDWQPPTSRPDDDKMYRWNESQLEWVAVS